MQTKLLMGNEAIAAGAIAAGVNLVCGYPGTPSTEIVEYVAHNNPGTIQVEWSTNEKAAIEVAAGASYSGARCLVTMKQVGLNVASDPLMCLNYVGIGGGVVIVVADDPGPISSQTEQDTRQFAQFAHIPVLDPESPEEAFDMVGEAFEISERYNTPVIIRPTTRVDHGCASIQVPAEKDFQIHKVAGFVKDPKWVIFPDSSQRNHREIYTRLAAIAKYNDTSRFNKMITLKNGCDSTPTLGVLASGDSTGYIREALMILNERAKESNRELPALKYLSLGASFPFPENLFTDYSRGLTDVLSYEELSPLLERSATEAAGRAHLTINVHGKLDGTCAVAGENSVEDALEKLATFMGVPELITPANLKSDVCAPGRPAVLCAGCPHRASFLNVKRYVAQNDQDGIYAGDIGCYTLGVAAPINVTDTCLDMGAGFTIAQGLAAFDKERLHFGFIGDSTFFASGMTGVANAVYNNHNVTFIVLDNSITAMTGSQPHPGTGKTLMGTQSVPISIPETLRALGVTIVECADPFNFAASFAAIDKAASYTGPSAVVFQSPCINLIPPLAPISIEGDTCIGCTKCVSQTGCPALSMQPTQENPHKRIALVDPALCWGCDLCKQYCPVEAIISPRADMSPTAVDALREASRRDK